MAMTIAPVLARLEIAINTHNLDGLVDCFADRVESVQPAHPARSFKGNDQVRQNWSQIFGGVPDLKARLIRHVMDRDTVWAEWEWDGSRRDGQRFEMRGVTILGIQEDRIHRISFYMEPRDESGPRIADSVAQAVSGGR